MLGYCKYLGMGKGCISLKLEESQYQHYRMQKDDQHHNYIPTLVAVVVVVPAAAAAAAA